MPTLMLVPLQQPIPATQRGAIDFQAIEAGRSAAGLVASIQVLNGKLVCNQLVQLAVPANRQAFATHVSTLTGLLVDDTESALLELARPVELALRSATHSATTSAANPQTAHPYSETAAGIVWAKPTPNGSVATLLTNFTARIIADIAEDDGAEVRRLFDLEATLAGAVHQFSVTAEKFAGMAWVTEHLGAGAIIFPSFSFRDHARVATQLFSGTVPQEHVYRHTGWRQVNGDWAYLHGDGAIGANGPVSGVVVRLSDALSRYILPLPPAGKQLMEAITASMRLLDVAPRTITLPIFAAVWRAILGNVDFSLHLSGATGVGKTELAALAQQHYGAGMNSRALAASWLSTGNSLESLAFEAKDTLFVVDDFAPTGSQNDVQRYHREADRLLRAQGNRAGRQRMRADASLRLAKPPRGLILSTGEDTPHGKSLRARLLALEMTSDDMDWTNLTECQRDAAAGLYAQAMSSYVNYLASNYGQIQKDIQTQTVKFRENATASNQHRRTPEIVASLAVGLSHFIDFAIQAGAMNKSEADAFWADCWQTLGEVAQGQSASQSADDPARRFIQLLGAAIVSGKVHVAGMNGAEPPNPSGWGWRDVTHSLAVQATWRPSGDRVGWLDGDDLYLQPDVAYAAVQRLARELGESIPLASQTLRKRLHEAGMLTTVDGTRHTITVRRTIENQRWREVLHISAGCFGT